MIYLSKITLGIKRPNNWPFNISIIKNMNELNFDTPVTFIAGENGTGKSTLIETLALKLKMPAIGRTDTSYDESLKALVPLANSMKTTMKAMPKNKFFLRSEDFFNFVLKLSMEQNDLLNDLKRVEEEYKDKSRFTKNQARSAYENSYYHLKRTYGDDLLEAASHGESFIRLFNSRISPNGLYILDEPAVPLSPLRQLTLMHIIKQMSEEQNCQFIIATHSPILLAYSKGTIYSLDNGELEKVGWQDLDSVQLLKDFFEAPDRYIDRL